MKTYGFLVTGVKKYLSELKVIDSLLRNYDPYHNEYMAKKPTAKKEDSQIHGKKT